MVISSLGVVISGVGISSLGVVTSSLGVVISSLGVVTSSLAGEEMRQGLRDAASRFVQRQKYHRQGGTPTPYQRNDDPESEVALREHSSREGQDGPEKDKDKGKDGAPYHGEA